MTVRTTVLLAGSAILLALLLTWSAIAFDATGVWFAFLVVWLPMAWLGTISRLVAPRLPDAWYRPRDAERNGRVYELVGVRVAKRLLRRGPLAVFNPDLHLPAERTAANLAHLEQRMKDAEASHAILFGLSVGIAAIEAAARRWGTAGWILLFNMVVNGYPVMLQRYNRVLLHDRFGEAAG